MDSGFLVEGEDAPFDEIVYRIGLRTLLDEGHLAAVTARGGSRKIDLGAVKVVRGEYEAGALETECNDILDTVVADVCEALQTRRAAIVFAASRGNAADLGARFAAAGVTCGVVDDSTAPGERARVVADVREGRLQVVCNVGVLTTGFNAPIIDVVAIARATMSTSLYVQIVGRGMRPAAGKADCLVLDYGGNVLRHGPVDAPRPLFAGTLGGGEAPMKECPTCKLMVATATRFCPECGHEWERKEAALMARYDGDVLASPEYVEGWRNVDVVNLRRHRKAGAPDSVRVDFACGLEIYSRWVCPEHPGRPRIWYESWCHESGVPVCDTVDEALTYTPSVTRIRVRRDGKHWLVVRQERA
jgi:DNA repair protein RadD